MLTQVEMRGAEGLYEDEMIVGPISGTGQVIVTFVPCLFLAVHSINYQFCYTIEPSNRNFTY